MKNCSTCKREFTQLFDYPEIIINKIEWPEEGITLEAFDTKQHWHWPIELLPAFLSGLKANIELNKFLDSLKEARKNWYQRTVFPKELLPPFSKNNYFGWAYNVPNSNIQLNNDDWIIQRLFIGYQEKTLGISNLDLYMDGPSMGSFGGSTLQFIGTLATIHYEYTE